MAPADGEQRTDGSGRARPSGGGGPSAPQARVHPAPPDSPADERPPAPLGSFEKSFSASSSRITRRGSSKKQAPVDERRAQQRRYVLSAGVSTRKRLLLISDLIGDELKVAWELSVMVSTAALFFYTPLRAAVEQDTLEGDSALWPFFAHAAIDLVVEVLLLPAPDLEAAPLRADTVASKKGDDVDVPGLVDLRQSREYLATPSFVMDALGVLAPIVGNVVVAATAASARSTAFVVGVHVLRFLVFLRGPRVSRAHDFTVRYTEFHDRQDYTLKFTIVVLLYMWCSHFAACIFIAVQVGGRGDEHASVRCALGGVPLAEAGDCYVDSLFWAVSIFTMFGYPASYEPVSTGEKVFNMAMVTVGAMLNALIFGTIAMYVRQVSRDADRRQLVMDDVNDFIADNGELLPLELQQTLRYHTYYNHRNRHLGSNAMLELMPDSVRQDVAYALHRQLLEQVPQFRALKPIVIAQMALAFGTANYMPGDSVLTQGENHVDPRMYFIKDGVCAAVKMVPRVDALRMDSAVVSSEMEAFSIGVTRIPTAAAAARARGHGSGSSIGGGAGGGGGGGIRLPGLGSRRPSHTGGVLSRKGSANSMGGDGGPGGGGGRARRSSISHDPAMFTRVILSFMGPGEHFGEIAVLLDVPRTVTVQAMSRAVLLTLSRAAFLRAMDECPEALREMIALTQRRLKPRQLWKKNANKVARIQQLTRGMRASKESLPAAPGDSAASTPRSNASAASAPPPSAGGARLHTTTPRGVCPGADAPSAAGGGGGAARWVRSVGSRLVQSAPASPPDTTAAAAHGGSGPASVRASGACVGGRGGGAAEGGAAAGGGGGARLGGLGQLRVRTDGAASDVVLPVGTSAAADLAAAAAAAAAAGGAAAAADADGLCGVPEHAPVEGGGAAAARGGGGGFAPEELAASLERARKMLEDGQKPFGSASLTASPRGGRPTAVGLRVRIGPEDGDGSDEGREELMPAGAIAVDSPPQSPLHLASPPPLSSTSRGSRPSRHSRPSRGSRHSPPPVSPSHGMRNGFPAPLAGRPAELSLSRPLSRTGSSRSVSSAADDELLERELNSVRNTLAEVNPEMRSVLRRKAREHEQGAGPLSPYLGRRQQNKQNLFPPDLSRASSQPSPASLHSGFASLPDAAAAGSEALLVKLLNEVGRLSAQLADVQAHVLGATGAAHPAAAARQGEGLAQHDAQAGADADPFAGTAWGNAATACSAPPSARGGEAGADGADAPSGGADAESGGGGSDASGSSEPPRRQSQRSQGTRRSGG